MHGFRAFNGYYKSNMQYNDLAIRRCYLNTPAGDFIHIRCSYGDHNQNNAEVVDSIVSDTDTQYSDLCYWCPLCQAHQ